MKYAKNDKKADKQAVLFKISWTMGDYQIYYMNQGAYPNEEQAVLQDGISFAVNAVEDTSDDNGEPLVVVSLR